MYESPPADALLSQGDIILDCTIASFEPAEGSDATAWRSRVIVLTHPCDLAHDKATRAVVALVHRAEDLVQRGLLKASVVRDQVRRGLVFGWYFLPAAPLIDFPESIVDLRDLHTVSRKLLEELIAQGKRLARIQSPYREHLTQHFALTYGRIALPEPYETQP
jgi:hypothetical protein